MYSEGLVFYLARRKERSRICLLVYWRVGAGYTASPRAFRNILLKPDFLQVPGQVDLWASKVPSQ